MSVCSRLLLPCNNSHATYRIKVREVRGTVMTQNRLNCGLRPMLMEPALVAPSQLKRGAEKSAATKFPGKNIRATNANIFMEDESFRLDRAVSCEACAVSSPARLSCWVTKLNT